MESGCRAIPRTACRPGARPNPAPSALGHDLRAHRHRIDAALADLPWAEKANIKTGADYLRAWVACAFRDPFEPLPYLFLWGNENSGKSILHEALELLVTKGVVKADKVLKSHNEFNGELAGAIICAVEETNVAVRPVHTPASRSMSPPARWPSARCGPTLPSSQHHPLDSDRQLPEPLPRIPGDTRITVIEVGDLLPEQEVPKLTLLAKLNEEAPHFMYTLLNLQLPPIVGRLRLPVVHPQQGQHGGTQQEPTCSNSWKTIASSSGCPPSLWRVLRRLSEDPGRQRKAPLVKNPGESRLPNQHRIVRATPGTIHSRPGPQARWRPTKLTSP